MSQIMNYTNKKLRAIAKERKIPHYYVMRKEKLCEILGIEYRPFTVRKTTPVTIRNIQNDETSSRRHQKSSRKEHRVDRLV